MVNAPTRPSNRPRSATRPPRGPSVARTPTSADRTIRARLAAASTTLTETGRPDLAAAVDEVLAPTGWGMLRRTEADSNTRPNMPIHMNLEIRELIKERAAAKGASLADDVNEGLRRFLSGEWEPTEPIRSTRNSGAEKANLNVRPDADLVQQVKDTAAQTSAALKWKVTPARIAAAWLMKKYRISAELQKK